MSTILRHVSEDRMIPAMTIKRFPVQSLHIMYATYVVTSNPPTIISRRHPFNVSGVPYIDPTTCGPTCSLRRLLLQSSQRECWTLLSAATHIALEYMYSEAKMEQRASNVITVRRCAVLLTYYVMMRSTLSLNAYAVNSTRCLIVRWDIQSTDSEDGRTVDWAWILPCFGGI